MLRFYWSTFSPELKTRTFCQRKGHLWTPVSNVWLQKGHVSQDNRTGWSSNLHLIISLFPSTPIRNEVERFHFYCFSPLGEAANIQKCIIYILTKASSNCTTWLIFESTFWEGAYPTRKKGHQKFQVFNTHKNKW